MKIAEELKNNLIADVENICEISLSEETRESLKRCFEITVGTHSLSLPPAEGTEIAEALYKWLSQQKYGDEALLHPAVCCDFVGMTRFKAALAEQIKINLPTQQQPTAEGAEEFLLAQRNGNDNPITVAIAPEGWIFKMVVKAMERFAALHAQKIADKMVEERLREELALYHRWIQKNKYTNIIHSHHECAAEYLKSREK